MPFGAKVLPVVPPVLGEVLDFEFDVALVSIAIATRSARPRLRKLKPEAAPTAAASAEAATPPLEECMSVAAGRDSALASELPAPSADSALPDPDAGASPPPSRDGRRRRSWRTYSPASRWRDAVSGDAPVASGLAELASSASPPPPAGDCGYSRCGASGGPVPARLLLVLYMLGRVGVACVAPPRRGGAADRRRVCVARDPARTRYADVRTEPHAARR